MTYNLRQLCHVKGSIWESTHTYTYTLWQLVYGVPLFQVHNEIHIAPYANNINISLIFLSVCSWGFESSSSEHSNLSSANEKCMDSFTHTQFYK